MHKLTQDLDKAAEFLCSLSRVIFWAGALMALSFAIGIAFATIF